MDSSTDRSAGGLQFTFWNTSPEANIKEEFRFIAAVKFLERFGFIPKNKTTTKKQKQNKEQQRKAKKKKKRKKIASILKKNFQLFIFTL